MWVQTILVPYDFLDHIRHAFRWAVALAKRWYAQIVLLHIILLCTNVSHPHANFLLKLSQRQAEMQAIAQQRLQEVVANEETGTIAVQTRVVLGGPFWHICQTAEEEHAHLIVMGSHGRTGLAYLPQGSVAGRVVRHAPCPALVARLRRTPDEETS